MGDDTFDALVALLKSGGRVEQLNCDFGFADNVPVNNMETLKRECVYHLAEALIDRGLVKMLQRKDELHCCTRITFTAAVLK